MHHLGPLFQSWSNYGINMCKLYTFLEQKSTFRVGWINLQGWLNQPSGLAGPLNPTSSKTHSITMPRQSEVQRCSIEAMLESPLEKVIPKIDSATTGNFALLCQPKSFSLQLLFKASIHSNACKRRKNSFHAWKTRAGRGSSKWSYFSNKILTAFLPWLPHQTRIDRFYLRLGYLSNKINSSHLTYLTLV